MNQTVRMFVSVAALVAATGAASSIAAAPASASAPHTVVVPAAAATAEGNYANAWPFNCGAVLISSQRYQQAYSGTAVGSGSITQIAFRPDGSASGFGPTTFPNVTITLSTTSAQVGALSSTFAANVGADVKTVYSGNLTLSSAATGSPRAFDITIPLQHAFTFNPSAGQNLLLDVTIPTCETTTQFDAVRSAADSSRAYTFSGGASSPTADAADSSALVTQFTIGSPGISQQVTETVNPGTLGFVSAPGAVTPPATTLTGIDQLTPAFGLPLDVGDATGSGNGWNVSLTATPFSDSHNHTLGALYQNSEGTPACDTVAVTTCTLATDTGAVVNTTSPVSYNTATLARVTDPNTGMGDQSLTPTYQLAIPANTYAGTYTSTWTVSLSSGPH